MRILTTLTDAFSLELNKMHGRISDVGLRAFKPAIQGMETNLIKLQYGPIEVEKVQLFHVEDVQSRFKELLLLLKGWHNELAIAPLAAPLGTQPNPMKRLSASFHAQLNDLRVSCSFNLQYSFSEYYRLDKNIMPLQDKLQEIDEEINAVNADTENKVWAKIKEELINKGVPVEDANYLTGVSRDEEKLAELFEDFMDLGGKYEALFMEKEKEAERLNKKKEPIQSELEQFVVEANVTEPVLLDDLGISTRKRGMFVYLDIQNVNGSDLSRDKISKNTESTVMSKFKEMEDVLNALMQRSD